MKKSELKQIIKNVIMESQVSEVSDNRGVPFDFENYDDTDLSGPSLEMAIVEMIEEAKRAIKKEIPNDIKLQTQARVAIKKLWQYHLNQWKS